MRLSHYKKDFKMRKSKKGADAQEVRKRRIGTIKENKKHIKKLKNISKDDPNSLFYGEWIDDFIEETFKKEKWVNIPVLERKKEE